MLELDISVVSKDAATKRQDRVDMYEMGGGATMHISDKIMVDGGDWELMPGGAPAMSLQGKKATWTIKFPKFVNSTMYDPTVVYASDETDTTDNTDNTDNTDDSEDTSETDDTDDSDTNGAGDGDGDGEGDDSGADGSGDMTITCAASAAVATCWDGIFEDASIETCDDLTQEMKDMALDCFLSNGCCDDFATNVPMWQQQFGASCAFPTCVSDFSNAVEVTTELAMTAAQFQAPAVKLGFRKAFAEVAGVALGAVKILSVSEKEVPDATRRLLATAIDVVTQVAAADAAAAAELSTKLETGKATLETAVEAATGVAPTISAPEIKAPEGSAASGLQMSVVLLLSLPLALLAVRRY